MSWSLTIDDLKNYPGPTLEDFERIARDNVSCVEDMLNMLDLAHARGFASCVISGGRTPTPPSDDEIVDISIRAMTTAKGVAEAIREAIKRGADESDRGTNNVPDQNGGG